MPHAKNIFSNWIKTEEIKKMSKLPISLVIDDAGPVNMYHYHVMHEPHDKIIPPAFALHFGRICQDLGVRGKFSVVPCPAGLGRLDRPTEVNGVDPDHIEAFTDMVKRYIMPNFSITSEILTHHFAVSLKTLHNTHQCEDTFVRNATPEEIADYVSLSLEILTNMGLNPTGVTSPWQTGLYNEETYAKGIGMAFKRTLKKDKCFYFLHCWGAINKPVIMFDTPETGNVVSIPCNAPDAFWDSQRPFTYTQAQTNVKEMIDSLISEDGRTGKLRELFEAGLPLIMLTHWQALYSDGRGTGIEGFEYLMKRINRIFGQTTQWMDFDEIAELTRK